MLVVRRSIERILMSTLLLSLILNTIALGLQQVRLFHWEGCSVYPLLVLISFTGSLLHAYRTRKSIMDELIEIDARLGLKERLSTAYECHQLGRKSIFVDLLINDAVELLGSFKSNQILPRNFSPTYLVIPFLTVVILILFSVDLTPRVLEQDRTGGERLKKIGIKMERYSERELQDIKKTKKKSRKDLFRQMEKIAEELKGQTMTKEKLLQSLGKLTREVEARQTQLARRLEVELSLGDISNAPMLKPLQKEKVTPNEVKQLKTQLKELFEGELPGSLSRDIFGLEQNCGLEQFLDKIMNEVRSALPVGDELPSPREVKDVFVGKASEDNRNTLPGHELVVQKSGEALAFRQISPVQRQPKAGSTHTEKSGQDPDEHLHFTAGREKAGGEKRPPYELEHSKHPALKDKGFSGQEERYSVYVRSLPIMGKATLKEEEVIRPYRLEIENVLQKEDIPLNYREYIKNYFLSIGLKKEENGNGGIN